MPSYKTAFGSFLRTEDLQNRTVRVVVDAVDLITIKGQDGKPDERKLAAHFAGKDKALVLNRSRCEQMEAIFGTDDYEQWVGPIMLVPGTTKFGGKTVGCINVAPPLKPGAKPAPPPASEPEEFSSDDVTEDSIPF